MRTSDPIEGPVFLDLNVLTSLSLSLVLAMSYYIMNTDREALCLLRGTAKDVIKVAEGAQLKEMPSVLHQFHHYSISPLHFFCWIFALEL